jgi:RNA polymerase sigma factor (TIGR02999 family)
MRPSDSGGPAAPPDVTLLLSRLRQGDDRALERLMPLVHDELRRLARYHMRGERAGHTLQPTALAHEAYMRLVDLDRIDWRGRAHFFAVAAGIMRRILIDHARKRRAARRGGGAAHVSLDEGAGVADQRPEELVALDDAMGRLAELDPRQERIVELRFFGGLSVDETAAVLGISARTVKREWAVARAWLRAELGR